MLLELLYLNLSNVTSKLDLGVGTSPEVCLVPLVVGGACHHCVSHSSGPGMRGQAAVLSGECTVCDLGA